MNTTTNEKTAPGTGAAENRTNAPKLPFKECSVKIDTIDLQGSHQLREMMRQEVVDEYTEAFTNGAKFPAVELFNVDGKILVADGHHRIAAATKAGFKDILGRIHTGARSDYIQHLVGTNSTHGLQRNDEEKFQAVALALQEFPTVSDREIARMAVVSPTYVGKTRKYIAEDPSWNPEVKDSTVHVDSCDTPAPEPEKRVGKDGKARRLPKKKAKKPAPATNEDEGGVRTYTPAEIAAAGSMPSAEELAEQDAEIEQALNGHIGKPKPKQKLKDRDSTDDWTRFCDALAEIRKQCDLIATLHVQHFGVTILRQRISPTAQAFAAAKRKVLGKGGAA